MADQENAAQDEANVLWDFPDCLASKTASPERTVIEIPDGCCITSGSDPRCCTPRPETQTSSQSRICIREDGEGVLNTRFGNARKRILSTCSRLAQRFRSRMFCLLRLSREAEGAEEDSQAYGTASRKHRG